MKLFEKAKISLQGITGIHRKFSALPTRLMRAICVLINNHPYVGCRGVVSHLFVGFLAPTISKWAPTNVFENPQKIHFLGSTNNLFRYNLWSAINALTMTTFLEIIKGKCLLVITIFNFSLSWRLTCYQGLRYWQGTSDAGPPSTTRDFLTGS